MWQKEVMLCVQPSGPRVGPAVTCAIPIFVSENSELSECCENRNQSWSDIHYFRFHSCPSIRNLNGYMHTCTYMIAS